MKYVIRALIGLSLMLIILMGCGLYFLSTVGFNLKPWDSYTESTNPSSSPSQPNVLLLVAEDMSFRVGAFGDKLAHTPHLDKLASEGVRYPNTFTTAGVCAPSRAALITGMHQISMGGQHMRTSTRPEGAYFSVPPPEVKAFPELLRHSGYYTFNTTKNDYQFSGAMTESGPFTIWDSENNQKLWRDREMDQPFFGMLNFNETHESGVFTPLGNKPNSFFHLILQVMRKVSASAYTGIEPNPSEIILPPYYPDTPTVRSDIARHYTNVSIMDQIVGDILDRLEQDGLSESTIVIWTTDHGDGLPRAKRELYDSGINVPMIIRWPKAYRPENAIPGTIDEQLISFVDLAPTLLQWSQSPLPSFLHGRAFHPADSSRRTYIYASRDRIDEVYDRQRAVRDEQFKYIRSWHPDQPGGHRLAFRDNLEMMKEMWQLKAENQLSAEQLRWFENPGKEQLFDTRTDPHELHNLSQDSSYTEVLFRMRAALDHWLSNVEDWSDVHENEMVHRFQPNGVQEKTPSPLIAQEEGYVEITNSESGASIGYRVDGGAWQLYTNPFKLPAGAQLEAKAVRYGWQESDIVPLESDR